MAIVGRNGGVLGVMRVLATGLGLVRLGKRVTRRGCVSALMLMLGRCLLRVVRMLLLLLLLRWMLMLSLRRGHGWRRVCCLGVVLLVDNARWSRVVLQLSRRRTLWLMLCRMLHGEGPSLVNGRRHVTRLDSVD
jgi:hypothetical protein